MKLLLVTLIGTAVLAALTTAEDLDKRRAFKGQWPLGKRDDSLSLFDNQANAFDDLSFGDDSAFESAEKREDLDKRSDADLDKRSDVDLDKRRSFRTFWNSRSKGANNVFKRRGDPRHSAIVYRRRRDADLDKRSDADLDKRSDADLDKRDVDLDKRRMRHSFTSYKQTKRSDADLDKRSDADLDKRSDADLDKRDVDLDKRRMRHSFTSYKQTKRSDADLDKRNDADLDKRSDADLDKRSDVDLDKRRMRHSFTSYKDTGKRSDADLDKRGGLEENDLDKRSQQDDELLIEDPYGTDKRALVVMDTPSRPLPGRFRVSARSAPFSYVFEIKRAGPRLGFLGRPNLPNF